MAFPKFRALIEFDQSRTVYALFERFTISRDDPFGTYFPLGPIAYLGSQPVCEFKLKASRPSV
jgi:hypothetical protein